MQARHIHQKNKKKKVQASKAKEEFEEVHLTSNKS